MRKRKISAMPEGLEKAWRKLGGAEDGTKDDESAQPHVPESGMNSMTILATRKVFKFGLTASIPSV
eukprot:1895542-Rhodomonas_salina.2